MTYIAYAEGMTLSLFLERLQRLSPTYMLDETPKYINDAVDIAQARKRFTNSQMASTDRTKILLACDTVVQCLQQMPGQDTRHKLAIIRVRTEQDRIAHLLPPHSPSAK